MSSFVVLPLPLTSGSIELGQLITDPVNAASSSFTPASKPVDNDTVHEEKYQTTVAHDEYGQFLRLTSEDSHLPTRFLMHLKADASSRSSLSKPRSAFDAVRQEAAARDFFKKAAENRQPLYYVSGIQTLKNPSSQRAGVAEAAAKPVRLPTHVRRVDSASSLDTERASTIDETILSLELLKVKAHVGLVNEPHTLDDLDYEWSYHPLDNGLQLSVGIGKALKPSELRALAGIVTEEDFTDASWDGNSSDDDGDGLGGF